MKTCSTCHQAKPETEYYNAYKYVKGWPEIVGKVKQCKSCCKRAKGSRPMNQYIDTKPIGDPIVNAGMKAWGR